MYRLTAEERLIVAFCLSALLVSMAVRGWRAQHPRLAGAMGVETKGH